MRIADLDEAPDTTLGDEDFVMVDGRGRTQAEKLILKKAIANDQTVTSVASLNSTVTQTLSQLQIAQANLADLQDRVANDEGSAITLGQQLAAAQAQVAALQTALTNSTNALNAALQTIASQGAAISQLQTGLTAAQNAITALQGSSVESANGSTIQPGSGTIKDHVLAAWTITGTLPGGGHPQKAASNYGGVSTAVLGLYWLMTMYFEDASGGWWKDNGTTLVTNVQGDPRAPITFTESVQGATASPGSGYVVDNTLSLWTMTGAGVVQKNAATAYAGAANVGTTSGGTQLLKWGTAGGTKIYYVDGSNVWRFWSGTTWTVDPAGDPRNPTSESPDGTKITNGAGQVIDASGNKITISGGQVMINGVASTLDGTTPNTSNVDVGWYTGHSFYQHNPNYFGNSQWWSSAFSGNIGTYTPLTSNVDPPGYSVVGGTPSRWRADTGNFAKNTARAWVYLQVGMRVNIEKGTAWTLNIDYAALKAMGVVGVRFFYPWSPTANLDGAGVGFIGPASLYDGRLGAAISAALAAGLYVQVQMMDVLNQSDTTGSNGTLVQNFITVMANMLAARAASDHWDLTKLAFGPVDEWGGTPGSAVNAFRITLHNICRQALGTQAILIINPDGWNGVDRLSLMQVPSDTGPMVVDIHKYPGKGVTQAQASATWASQQSQAITWSDANGGIPVVIGEWGSGFGDNSDGGGTDNTTYVAAIGAIAAGAPEMRPAIWALTIGGWFRINKAANDPTIMDGTGGQPNIKAAITAATATIKSLAA